MQITLPYPPKPLNPNKRIHWAALAKAKKAYREVCAWEAKKQGAVKLSSDKISVSLTFHPPDNRKRDIDNMLASMKSGLDGIADAIGIDDSKWRISLDVGNKGGFVVVHIVEDACLTMP